ncbi:MAG: hypothetical protein GYB67_05175 [Chloroflexi bacterium]|nr:hypothetical protein [Chloroflexota bacterium]
MRIRRDYTRQKFRSRRQRPGCFSQVLLIGALVGVAIVFWQWLGIGQPFDVMPPDDRLASATVAFARGDLDSAIVQSRQRLNAQPDDVGALKLLTRALIYRSYSDYDTARDRDTALAFTTAAYARRPNHPEVAALHAFALQAVSRPGAAADVARTVLEAQPDHALARTSLALAYGVARSYEVALRESLRALEALGTPTTADDALDVLRALAISYSDTGDYNAAVQTVERALTLNDRLAALYFERALYAMQLGDVDAATVAYYEILAQQPENVKVRLRLCELSSLLRERETALRYCDEVTTRAPAWFEGWYHLGREYFLQGVFLEAQTAFQRCTALQHTQQIAISERRIECWLLQGQAAEIRGDCSRLVAIYNEFRVMAATGAIDQTWEYPPEGPPNCASGADPQGGAGG